MTAARLNLAPLAAACCACAAPAALPAPKTANTTASTNASTNAGTNAGTITSDWGPAAREEALARAAAAVWKHRLPDAQEALLAIADREIGQRDPALDYWSELLALLRCEPPSRAPGRTLGALGPWDHVRRLAQLERMRFELPPPPAAPARPPAAPGAPDARPPAAAGPAPAASKPRTEDKPRLVLDDVPAASLGWPVENERWPDETPLALTAGDRCGTVSYAVPAASEVATVSVTATLPAPRRRAEPRWSLVSELVAALPAGHPALPELLIERAVLAVEGGEPLPALDALARLSSLVPADRFSPADQKIITLTWAVAADIAAGVQADKRQEAITRIGAALALDWPAGTRRALTFRLAEELRAAGRVAEAVSTIGPPPHGDDVLGRYMAYSQMETHTRAGRRAEALAEARAALGRLRHGTVDADAVLSAIDDLATRILVASPLQAETLEVLESLGVPEERLVRMERFAQAAVAAGAQASGMEAFLWLAENDPDPAHKLHDLARASVAAARAGDGKQFARTFALLAGQEEEDASDPLQAALNVKPKAPPKPQPTTQKAGPQPAAGLIASPEGDRLYRTRRRELSLSWQRAMLVVARDALPALVDSDDQANLKVLVDRLQSHLTTHGRGPVDGELTTIYRAASAHLRKGPRAYAERVGSGKRPILLGDVSVERSNAVRAPVVTIVPHGPRTLLWVPQVGTDPSPARLARWSDPLGVSLLHEQAKEDKKEARP